MLVKVYVVYDGGNAQDETLRCHPTIIVHNSLRSHTFVSFFRLVFGHDDEFGWCCTANKANIGLLKVYDGAQSRIIW